MSHLSQLPTIPLNKPVLNGIPLLVEKHPSNYNGLPYLTLIQYHQSTNLVIVDNCVAGTVRGYVLDLCESENLDTVKLLNVVEQWFYDSKDYYPISIEFGKLGIANQTSKILRVFQTDFIQRIIGPVPKYDMGQSTTTVKRKRCVRTS